ncbi:DNA-directed RNA polymerase, subunit E'' [Desulfurococcaceae archaeon MEX13E-LK6-19]|nr:DNA-directed RNA polymerase, subunit E'' [Desulfurococcaceae archaeon MEX13E-LK6-19]
MPIRVKRKPLKACRKCRALVEREAEVCPLCGSRDFTEDWEGMVVIIDPEKSDVARLLEIKKPGRYAIKVR